MGGWESLGLRPFSSRGMLPAKAKLLLRDISEGCAELPLPVTWVGELVLTE